MILVRNNSMDRSLLGVRVCVALLLTTSILRLVTIAASFAEFHSPRLCAPTRHGRNVRVLHYILTPQRSFLRKHALKLI